MTRIINPFLQFFSDDNVVLEGGMLFFYQPGSLTPKDTYSSPNFTPDTRNSNPIVLGTNGRPPQPIYFDGSARVIIQDSEGEQIDDQDNVDSSGSVDVPLAPWSSSTDYVFNTIVRAMDGKLYQSITTSGSNINNPPPTSPAFWQQIEFVGIWNINVIYGMNDLALFEGGLYVSLVDDNQGNSPSTSPTEWGATVTVVSNWDAETTYAMNDTARGSNGLLYTSETDNNQGNDPTTDSTNWRPAVEGSRITGVNAAQLEGQTIGTDPNNIVALDASARLPAVSALNLTDITRLNGIEFADYSANRSYSMSEIVREANDDRFYKSITNGNLNNLPSTSPTHWQEVFLIGRWNNQITYNAGDVVLDNNANRVELFIAEINGITNQKPFNSPDTWRIISNFREWSSEVSYPPDTIIDRNGNLFTADSQTRNQDPNSFLGIWRPASANRFDFRYGHLAPHENILMWRQSTESRVSIRTTNVTVTRALNNTTFDSLIIDSPAILDCDLETTGMNGRDQAANFGANATVYFFLVFNPSTRALGTLASLSLDAPSLPVGFTYFGLLGAAKRNGGVSPNNLFPFVQRDRQAVSNTGTVLLNQAANATASSNLSNFVPAIAKRVLLNVSATAAGVINFGVGTGLGIGNTFYFQDDLFFSSTPARRTHDIMIDSAAQFVSRFNGTGTYTLSVAGWSL